VKTPRTAPAEHAQRRVKPDDKFSSLDGKFSSITAVETLSATVGSAGSGLVKRVDALEKAPLGEVVVPVNNVRPILRAVVVVGAQV